MAGIDEVYEMVVKGKTKAVELAVQEALAEGCAPAEILNAGMIRAMDEVGAQFKTGEIFHSRKRLLVQGFGPLG